MSESTWNALGKYFSGEASTEDVTIVGRADPKLIKDAQLLWDAAGVVGGAGSEPISNVDAAWNAEVARLDAEARNTMATFDTAKPVRVLRSSGSGRARPQRGTWSMLAAAAIVIVASGVSYELVQRREPVTGASTAVLPDRVFATRRAQRADVYLTDGTHVILNVDSRLLVPATYGHGSRTVTLEGEAFFEVKHDSTRPFRVHTKAGVAEDLGTAFAVASYAENRGMRVSVSSGEVVVRGDSSDANARHLRRGDVARVDAAGSITVGRLASMDDELAWTTGRLVFDRVPLAEVLPQMSRWFDTELRLGATGDAAADSALARVRYTASFKNEPLAYVLGLMSKSLGASVVQDGPNSYVLRQQR